MTPRALSIPAAGKRFAVVLKQAGDGWLAYPEGSNLDTFGPDTQPAFPSEP